MAITEIKERLHQNINDIEDEAELKWLLLVFNNFHANRTFWNGLTPKEMELSLQYMQQLKYLSKILPESEILAMLNNWKSEL